MASSYRLINYALRPAKTAERKMLSDTFRRLSSFDKIESYGYVGFGSTYFSDFSLFHRLFGIDDMVSIEKDNDSLERFKFNKPYSCIDIKFDLSENILPNLDWSKKKIVWLDYDDPFNASMLVDLNTFISEGAPGSMFLMSFNAKPETSKDPLSPKDLAEFRYSKLCERIGDSKIPINVNGSHLALSGLPKVYYNIFIDEIDTAIKARNYRMDKDDKVIFKPIINFVYQDGAQMQTVGGMLIDEKQIQLFDNANFYDLPFIRQGEEPFKIEIPNLTFKEIRHLDSVLHSECDILTGEINESSDLSKIGIPPSDVKKYVKVYRYFPTFAESIF